MRICSKPGCPNVHDKPGMCPTCARERDRARGTKTQRGYGPDFQRERRQWIKTIELGNVRCYRCAKPIKPGDPFHLDHDDNNRDILRGPSCPRCNLSAAGRASHT
jgi:hypothetical protein